MLTLESQIVAIYQRVRHLLDSYLLPSGADSLEASSQIVAIFRRVHHLLNCNLQPSGAHTLVFYLKMKSDFYGYLVELEDPYRLDNNKRATNEAFLFYQRTMIILLYSYCFLFTIFFIFIMFLLFYKNFRWQYFFIRIVFFQLFSLTSSCFSCFKRILDGDIFFVSIMFLLFYKNYAKEQLVLASATRLPKVLNFSFFMREILNATVDTIELAKKVSELAI
ncbi:hypothetical protein AMTRI_Chr04g183070 [Amborella trichopoda]